MLSMLFLLLLCLLNLTIVNSTVLYLPDYLRNGTERFDLSGINATVAGTDHDAVNNAISPGSDIDRHFRTVMDTNPGIRISGKSTYMNILKAMIQLSYSEGTHAYAGETFSFRGYTDVKIRITRITSSSTTLQYRYAVWGLFKAAEYMSRNNKFTCTIVSLYWDGSGVPVLAGIIKISPNPLLDITSSKELPHLVSIGQQAQTPSNSSNLANVTSNEYSETDRATITDAGEFKVFIELQGKTLSIKVVFMMLLSGLLHIASFPTAHHVQDFLIRDSSSRTEFQYENYGAASHFTYHAAARALALVPKYMFAQSRFEAATFVVEIGSIPAGTGYLRNFSPTSDGIRGR